MQIVVDKYKYKKRFCMYSAEKSKLVQTIPVSKWIPEFQTSLDSSNVQIRQAREFRGVNSNAVACIFFGAKLHAIAAS